MRGFFSFWGRALGHAFSFGWLVSGLVSAIIPDIVAVCGKLAIIATVEPIQWVSDHPLRTRLIAVGIAILAYLAYAPYRLYRERDLEAKKTERERDALRSDQIEQRDRVLLACVDAISQGVKPLRALMDARADELANNEDVLYVCHTLEKHGHDDPVKELVPLLPGGYLPLLRAMRLKAINVNDGTAVYDFLMCLLTPSPLTPDKEASEQRPT